MNILGKKVILRAMEIEDCKFIQEMFNNPGIEEKVVGWSFPLSEYAQEQWFKSHYNDNNNLRFVIETKENRAVGIVTLLEIDWKNGNARHGIKIANVEQRSKGIGTDAVMAIMRYAFDEMHLNRLESNILEDNIISRNLYKKCGWKDEGIRRKRIYKGGKYKDLVMTGILASEYYELIERNNYWGD